MLRAALLLLIAPAIAVADSQVTVSLSPEGMALANQLGISPAELAQQIRSDVDDAYNTNDVAGFLRSFSDATSFSARGIGVDYASTPVGFLVGLAVNAAAAGNGEVSDDESPTAGVAANFALMLGMNLKNWDLPKWTVFANGFYQSAATDELDGNLLSLGGHLQYRLIEPTQHSGSGSAVRWLGVSLTSGFEFTRWKLGAAGETLSTDFDVAGANGDAELTLDQAGRFDLETTAITVPFEASTGFRIALLFSVYGGVGIDLTGGKSTLDASLDGTLRAENDQNVGSVQVTANGDNTGSPATARVFAGAQLNLWNLKLFVQANASQVPAASIAAGFRFVQ
ncbi:MAG TPA: hypothetical protein VK427_21085 [Kofleriaceae bacterium]|nr:hypothetical protein [Kofleriaceae bacterium]